ncbi:uncharacterized protein LOC108918611 isoform X3 [Scleropages formosus]|uniref:uncharacterized protein LOC108918611 isoform X3 n=1 Tax=Scleropages formosus TaxID=113540 RepID=UPI0010FA7BA5|nr:uncharacterized protein LOC108918611 isoform X3 [Scleropages formosus]
MRRKTKAKRVLEREHDDDDDGSGGGAEEDENDAAAAEEEEGGGEPGGRERERSDARSPRSALLCHAVQKRRKQMLPARESGEPRSSSSSSAASSPGLRRLGVRAFEFDNPTVEHFTDSDFTPEESDYLQSRSKAELIAMVLCMQSEMESLKEQIRCLTACGKLARNLEALIERTQEWSNGNNKAPSMPPVATVEGEALMPALLNGQWVKQETSSREPQPEPSEEPQRNGVYSEFITPQLLERCNTGTTAQKLTNDLLRGLYERECLASHSISGIVYNKRGQPKPALPADEVQAILRTVQYFFPGKTDAEIKGYIRQKLQNEAKRLRRKPQLSMKTDAHVEPRGAAGVYT